MGLLLAMRSPGLHLLLVICLVKLSKQQSTPTGIEVQFQNLQSVLLGRLDEVDNTLRNMDTKMNNIADATVNEIDYVRGRVDLIFTGIEDLQDRYSASVTSVTDPVNEIKQQAAGILEHMALMKLENESLNATLKKLTETTDVIANEVNATMDLMKEDRVSFNGTLNQLVTTTHGISNGINVNMLLMEEDRESFNATLKKLTETTDVIANEVNATKDLIKEDRVSFNDTLYQLVKTTHGLSSEIKTTSDLMKQERDLVKDKLNTISEITVEVANTLQVAMDNITLTNKNMATNINTFKSQVNRSNDEKSLLTFNTMDISLYAGQSLELECGIIGMYKRCFWKHDGAEYQISEIKQGTYPDIASTSNSSTNQCGIVVSEVAMDHAGDWSCIVLTKGKPMKATKKITVEQTTLIFNETDIPAHINDEIRLECGVDGAYHACHWENSGDIYQVADIRNGSHSNMKTDSTNAKTNQCSIVIKSFKVSHNGGWTCKVTTTFGPTLFGSKNIGCSEGFFMSKGANKCHKIFKDTRLSWSNAKIKCKKEGLEQSKNTDAFAIALRKDLTDTYGSAVVWLDARGTSDGKMMWMTDWTQVTPDRQLWVPGYGTSITGDKCLVLDVHKSTMDSNPETPYYDYPCTATFYALCQEP